VRFGRFASRTDADTRVAAIRAAGLSVRGAVFTGGGSTTMTVRRNVVTRPSDATGERPVGDAIVVGKE
jgi:exopolysaccharide biosynthesis protein